MPPEIRPYDILAAQKVTKKILQKSDSKNRAMGGEITRDGDPFWGHRFLGSQHMTRNSKVGLCELCVVTWKTILGKKKSHELNHHHLLVIFLGWLSDRNQRLLVTSNDRIKRSRLESPGIGCFVCSSTHRLLNYC